MGFVYPLGWDLDWGEIKHCLHLLLFYVLILC
jgi:hypothetical protein